MNKEANPNRKGRLFIFSAPSGAGKTTLLEALVKSSPNLYHSISHTTRKIRKNETNGINYHFISTEIFQKMILENNFFEHATVFGHQYGTSKGDVERRLVEGKDLALDIDWQGARSLKKVFPESISVFILPPSLHSLRERLIKRGDEQAEIVARMNEARNEIRHFNNYDYLIFNNEFDQTLSQLEAILEVSELETGKQKAKYKQEIDELIEA